jgi:hypothetical protein
MSFSFVTILQSEKTERTQKMAAETPQEDEKPAAPSAEPKPITKRTANDVLCGRGLPIQTHHGNVRLHSIVAEHREQYIALPRKDKPTFIKAIVQDRTMKMPGKKSTMPIPTRKWAMRYVARSLEGRTTRHLWQ